MIDRHGPAICNICIVSSLFVLLVAAAVIYCSLGITRV